jgi:hypothetical protein
MHTTCRSDNFYLKEYRPVMCVHVYSYILVEQDTHIVIVMYTSPRLDAIKRGGLSNTHVARLMQTSDKWEAHNRGKKNEETSKLVMARNTEEQTTYYLGMLGLALVHRTTLSRVLVRRLRDKTGKSQEEQGSPWGLDTTGAIIVEICVLAYIRAGCEEGMGESPRHLGGADII